MTLASGPSQSSLLPTSGFVNVTLRIEDFNGIAFDQTFAVAITPFPFSAAAIFNTATLYLLGF